MNKSLLFPSNETQYSESLHSKAIFIVKTVSKVVLLVQTIHSSAVIAAWEAYIYGKGHYSKPMMYTA